MESSSQNRAVAYSVLAHIYDKGTLANGPYDIFVPIVKNALSELYPSGTVKGCSISEISNSIQSKFSLTIPLPVLNNILKIIASQINKASGKNDMRIFDDGSFWIDSFIFEDYSELIKKESSEVAKISQLFNKFCKANNLGDINNETDLYSFIEQNRADISYYLSHKSEANLSGSRCNVLVANFIETFKLIPEVFDKIRDLYLGSMLACYLDYKPTNIKMDVELLLDTNFIVSLLDLNTPESTDTCITLIKVCRNFGYTFTVLKDTIEETQALLAFKSANLQNAIIAKNINKEDIYNACDRRHLSSADLIRISDNLEEQLCDKFGIHIIPCTKQWKGKAKFSKEYSIIRKYRNNDKAALHDAIALMYVRERRGNKLIKDFHKVNCWFVNNAITHENESVDLEYKDLYNSNSHQPEIIKVDNLLNIIWLSNPSVDVNHNYIATMGIASLVSYSLNASLPKARIIKELDDNIQKYREIGNITDQDVINLSTRIVNRQIKDVQAINDLAKSDEKAFALRVKEESVKQEQIESARVQNFDKLFQALSKGIKEIKENQVQMKEKYVQRMQELDYREKGLIETDKIRDIETEALRAEKNRLANEKENLEKEKTKNEFQLKKLWENENQRRRKLKENFIQKKIHKTQFKSTIMFVVSILLLIIIVGLSIYYYSIADEDKIQEINNLCNFKPLSYVLNIAISLVNIFTIQNFYNWNFNPSFIVNKQKLISIPDEYEAISFEDYLKNEINS